MFFVTAPASLSAPIEGRVLNVQLSAAHWVYLGGIVVILVTMVLRKNIVVPAILGTFLTALVFSGSLITGLSSIFMGSLIAAKELFTIFLIIALVTAMLGALRQMGADQLMVAPFRKVMRGGTSSFVVLGVVTYVISLFFWPTPAVPLVGAVLIPVAIRAGLAPMSVGMVIAICGQGMALSSDYVIKVAPGISATAAGADADTVADKALVMSLIVGAIALAITFITQKRTWRSPSPDLLAEWESEAEPGGQIPANGEIDDTSDSRSGGAGPKTGHRWTDSPSPSGATGAVNVKDSAPVQKTIIVEPVQAVTADDDSRTLALASAVKNFRPKTFAVLVPVVYLIFMIYLVLGKFTDSVAPVRGGDAAAIVGGIAVLVLIAVTLTSDRATFFEATSEHLVDGLVFAFKAMGIVLPIAGFFFIGNADFSAAILGMSDDAQGPAILFDLVNAAQSHLPQNPFITSFGMLVIGLIAGLEGSGFTGLPLTGSLSGALGPAVGMDPSTLAAIGQMGNIWSGGGTLVAWSSLIAIAGFARVPVIDLARKCFVPVITGLIACTVFAVIVY